MTGGGWCGCSCRRCRRVGALEQLTAERNRCDSLRLDAVTMAEDIRNERDELQRMLDISHAENLNLKAQLDAVRRSLAAIRYE